MSDRRQDAFLLPGVQWVAWVMWAGLLVSTCVMVAGDPFKRSVTHNYRAAAEALVQSAPMYAETLQQHGWIYPVQSAMLYVPFVLPPVVVGEVLWRVLCVGLYVWAIWRLSRVIDRVDADAARVRVVASGGAQWVRVSMLLLTILTLPAAIGSVRNGQMNTPMAACFVLAAVSTIGRRWWWAAGWLTLALAFKPIAIVLVLLFGAVHRPLWWRVPIGVVMLAALPFVHPQWGYVAEQYRLGLATVLKAGEPGAGVFAELTSLLRVMRIEVPELVMTGVRGVAALATLGLAWLAVRRFDAAHAAIAVLGLGTAYLMLFNPRTEGNSYLIVGPAMAAFAVLSLGRGYGHGVDRPTRPSRPVAARVGWALAVGCVVLGTAHLIIPGGRDLVLRPLVTLGFLMWLGVVIVRGRRGLWYTADQETSDASQHAQQAE